MTKHMSGRGALIWSPGQNETQRPSLASTTKADVLSSSLTRLAPSPTLSGKLPKGHLLTRTQKLYGPSLETQPEILDDLKSVSQGVSMPAPGVPTKSTQGP